MHLDDVSADRAGAEQVGVALAHRQDFAFGNALIRPSIRTISGPGEVVTCEPRAMQVLLALIDAEGAVLSREDLLRLCWDGRIVGDDAVNRAIAAVRRTGSAAGADFNLETIPRIGYRIQPMNMGADGLVEPLVSPVSISAKSPVAGSLSRRTLVTGSLALAAGVAASGWGFVRWRDREEYLERVEQARRLLDTPEELARAQDLLEEVTASWPDRAEAWGLLAHAKFKSAEIAPFQQTGALVTASERAASRALAIDFRQSDALLATALLGFSLTDWLDTEQRVRQVIDLAPTNTEAIEFLVVLLQCVGRCTESREWLDRAMAIKPMQPTMLFKKALKHWIFGEVAEADRVIDGALQLWPRNEWVWNTRLMIYAFTGRPRAAIAMLDDVANRPATMLPSTANVWFTALNAMDTRAPSDIAKARESILESAPHGPANAGQGVMLLSELGEMDAAFEVADGLLFARGDNVGSIQSSMDGRLINSQGWRRTQWLFIPATSALRADARFESLCEGLGLLDYWQQAEVWPDEFVRGSLAAKVS